MFWGFQRFQKFQKFRNIQNIRKQSIKKRSCHAFCILYISAF